MKSSYIATVASLVLLWNRICPTARAELSPDSYANFQAAAPEFITGEVQRMSITKQKAGDDTLMDITVVVRVKEVSRTASNIRPGQIVTICYHRTERAVPLIGPGEIPLLKAGQTYPMFLRCDEKKRAYVPAARSYSFQPMMARPTNEPKAT